MNIETLDNEVIIKIPSTINSKSIQSIIDYFEMAEILVKNKGTEGEAEELASEVNNNWWLENKPRFIK